MVLDKPACSLYKLPKTSRPSPLSTTAAQLLVEEDSVDVEVLQSSGVVARVVLHQLDVVDVVHSNVSVAQLPVDEEVNKGTTTDSRVDEEAEEDVVLAGKTTTNHNATVMPVSLCDQTGKCLRRSTSTA